MYTVRIRVLNWLHGYPHCRPPALRLFQACRSQAEALTSASAGHTEDRTSLAKPAKNRCRHPCHGQKIHLKLQHQIVFDQTFLEILAGEIQKF